MTNYIEASFFTALYALACWFAGLIDGSATGYIFVAVWAIAVFIFVVNLLNKP